MRDIRDIKAAVVGTGFIGVVHVEALRRLGIEVTGIVGSTPERAAEKARTAGLPEPYPSFEAMLEDPAVEVVAFTATQIPGIADRRYPPELAGPLYPAGIPILAETELEADRKSTRLNSSHIQKSRMPSSA